MTIGTPQRVSSHIAVQLHPISKGWDLEEVAWCVATATELRRPICEETAKGRNYHKPPPAVWAHTWSIYHELMQAQTGLCLPYWSPLPLSQGRLLPGRQASPRSMFCQLAAGEANSYADHCPQKGFWVLSLAKPKCQIYRKHPKLWVARLGSEIQLPG